MFHLLLVSCFITGEGLARRIIACLNIVGSYLPVSKFCYRVGLIKYIVFGVSQNTRRFSGPIGRHSGIFGRSSVPTWQPTRFIGLGFVRRAYQVEHFIDADAAIIFWMTGHRKWKSPSRIYPWNTAGLVGPAHNPNAAAFLALVGTVARGRCGLAYYYPPQKPGAARPF